mmetsp:Transcript_16555/g.26690  ORF Transcript_16555/g.26690 Transcript_16555/m.26690 type:complete len:221 (+) Transcript_16555:1404-2066(+)
MHVSTARILDTAMARVSSAEGIVSATRHCRRCTSHTPTNASISSSAASASSYSARSWGTSLKAGASPRMAHSLASLYVRVLAKSFRAKVSAACATATRPVNSLWPIMSMVRMPFAAGTYWSPRMLPKRLRSAPLGTRRWSKRTHALSRSNPVVFRPMSLVTIPGCGRRVAGSTISTRKPCGPRRCSPTRRSAITTALSAVNPCDIQFFHAPSLGEWMTNS